MASPFAEYANARIAYRAVSGAPTNLREGLRTTASSIVVIEAFISFAGQPSEVIGGRPESDGRHRGMAATVTEREGRGYITRWATVPLGESYLDAGGAWTWQEDGLRPATLAAGLMEHQCYLGDLSLLPATDGMKGLLRFVSVGWSYGDGGIGIQLREEAGDRFQFAYREGV